jgi:electron transport complex protein RnfG
MFKRIKEKVKNKKNSKKKKCNSRVVDALIPTLVLTLICLVSVSILVGTYSVTKPVIDENNAIRADLARKEVFPMAGVLGFQEFSMEKVKDISGGRVPDGLLEVYLSNSHGGMVLTTVEKGFGGTLKVITGLDSKGRITGITITEHSETPGLGTKPMTSDFLQQYYGKKKITNSPDGPEEELVDGVTGATISSDAIYRAVEKALRAYEMMGGIPHD